MKFVICIILFSISIICKAQSLQKEKNYQDCKDIDCQIKVSFLNAEYFLEADDITSSQKWLDISRSLISLHKIDTTTTFINSLQSELFYYNGLYQFGINEAEKTIKNGYQLKDSTLISNGYFFKGINLVELSRPHDAEKFLWKSRDYQPKTPQKKQLRSAILSEHIYNNLAQVKQQLKQSDSAIWYNTEAYEDAKKNNSYRGIANIEQMFTQIYLDKNDVNTALIYLNKSIASAEKSRYFDIVLANYGLMLRCYAKDTTKINFWFNKGLDLIAEKKINNLYQVNYFKIAIAAFENNNELENLALAQGRLINISQNISFSNNDYIQNISNKYLQNESKLFQQKLDLIKSQRERQFYFISSIGLIMFSLGIWYFFKQKHRINTKEIITLQQQREITKLQAFIEGEEKERIRLAEDLHDGINGDLSSIKFQLSSIAIEALSTENKQRFSKAITMIDLSCDQVRNISHNLSPTAINEFGLINSVQNYCSKLEQFHPIKINFQHFGNAFQLSKTIETVIYRIIQELVNNIIKHAKATQALVQINSHEDNLFITVEDNGIGYDQFQKNDGIGLKNIASRIAFLNATLEEEHNPKGTTFSINIDLNKIPKT